MEPITHLLTGASLSRAGFNRKTVYATLAMTLAAEAADLDMLWAAGGPVDVFQHHRGWTHAFIGAPVVATAVVGVVWLWHRWRQRKPQQPVVALPGHEAAPQRPALPLRWGLLWLFSLLAALSHILLDYTNNYGIRPFFPFNPRWYSADIVFIFEPVIFAALLLALVAPAIFGLVDRELGAKRQPFRGRGWAIFALVVMALTWTWREAEHHHALALMQAQDFTRNGQPQPLLRVHADPYPGNPFHWHAIAETPDFFQMADIDTRTETVTTDTQTGLLYKPPVTLSTLVAKRSWLGQAYLDWSQYPYVEDLGNVETPDVPAIIAAGMHTVRFSDLRFAYSTMLINGTRETPLSGYVVVNANRQVEEMRMDGRVQH